MHTLLSLLGGTAVLVCAGTVFGQSVPPSEAERRAAQPAAAPSTTPTLDALGTVTKIKGTIHNVPKIADGLTGGHYEKALGVYGKAIKAADVSIKLGRGYYREGMEGMEGVNEAIEGLGGEAATAAAIQFTTGIAAGYVGVAAAPVAAAATLAYAAGSVADHYYGQKFFDNVTAPAFDGTWATSIFNATSGAAFDAAYGMYDRHVLEPQREAMGQSLREKHQRTKADNAARAAAQPAVQPSGKPFRGPPAPEAPPAEPIGPSPLQQLLGTVIQIQQNKQQARAAANPPPGAAPPDGPSACRGGTCR